MRVLRPVVIACVLCLCACLGVWGLWWACRGSTRPGDFVDVPLDLRTIHNFLTPEECDAIKAAAETKGMQPSTVVDSHANSPSANRTSSTVFLADTDAPVVARVFAKVSALTGAPRSRFEDLQVISYEPGQKYEAHYDPCFKCSGSNLLREYTVLMYLNDDFEGGSTDFPLAGKSVRPVRGMATMFKSMHDDKIVVKSKHRGAPVTQGTKWAATVWIRPEHSSRH